MLPVFMTNPLALLCQRHLSRRFTLSLTIEVVSTIGWLIGLTAVLAGCSSNSASNSPSPTPTLSSISAEEIKNYAKAVLEIDSSRRAAYEDIQKLSNDEKIPDVTCTKADTIAALPKSIQVIAVNYCNKSKKIGESHGLTIPQFNAITVSAQSNPDLKKRIQNEIISLKNKVRL